ncbi:MFS transporter [uncultured Ligilactobacillus sp.]|uniref:MFS transporter n=2 Tax=uncultured Ligilactobacillus sp. TaxID=2837633 RepID=UPI00272CB658|nr:MFS transporter [uncultured Ligilactobacillus sp.]
MKQLQKNIKIFYLATTLTTLAASLPHAVLTVLLFAKGLSLTQIMLVQATYSLVILVSEYPSGLLADLYSKKALFLWAKVFLLGMFLLVWSGESFQAILLAWACYGLAMALESGTLDAQLINELKHQAQDRLVAKFISNTNRLDLIGALFGGVLGSWLYYRLGIRFYLVSVLLTLVAFLAIRYGYIEEVTDSSKQNLKQSLIKQVVTGFRELKHSRQLRLMIALTIAGQFFFQAHYQLWQALFLKQGFNKEQFYIYYVIFQLISLGAYSLPVKLETSAIKRWYWLSLIGLLTGSVLLVITDKMSFLLSYLVLVFIFTFFEYFSNVLFSKTVSKTHISSLTSLRSSCGRLASLVSLLLSSLLLTYLSVKVVVLLNFILAMIASLGVIYLALKTKTAHT